MNSPKSSTRRSGPRGFLVFNGYRWLARFAEVLPRSAIPFVSGLAGSLGVRCSPGKRKLVASHLRRVTGADPSKALVRKAFASYVRYWLEALRLPSVPAETLGRHVDLEGLEHVTDARSKANGVILALPHLGNWDVAGRWLVESGVPLVVVAERLEPPKLLTWFTDFRTSLGFEVLINGPNIAGEISAALKENKTVALLCDRDVDGTGRPTEFFGEVTPMPGGAAVLALRTGAALLPVGVYCDGLRYRFVVEPPIDTSRVGEFRSDVARVQGDLVRSIEKLIRAAPEQWHLFGPNWPSDREL